MIEKDKGTYIINRYNSTSRDHSLSSSGRPGAMVRPCLAWPKARRSRRKHSILFIKCF